VLQFWDSVVSNLGRMRGHLLGGWLRYLCLVLSRKDFAAEQERARGMMMG
jgi:hypothetical protein